MSDFYHDRQNDLLIYPHRSDRITTHVPEARVLNGHVIVPRTLRSSQILRWLGHSVPEVMTDYDWPACPGIKPWESQKLAANFMVLHPRSFNLSDMGCVGGETLIDTSEGPVSIESLCYKGKRFKVRSLTNEGPRFVEIAPPFAKGHDALYRIKFQSGREIVVTNKHVFLTCRGWVSCAGLAVGESLPVFDAYPQESTWAPCLLRSPLDVRRSCETTSDYARCFENLSCGERLLLEEDSGLFSPPSPTDVPAPYLLRWRRGAMGNIHTNNLPTELCLPSKHRYAAQIGQGEMGGFLSECATTLNGNQLHICARYRLFPIQPREADEGQELRLCIPLREALRAPFDTVAHIAYDRTDVYYDMHVPAHENYVAHGLCNHNTGKTISTLWAADWLMRQHPRGEFRALIVCPLSIMQRVWSDAIFKNFLGKRSFSVLYGTPEQRLARLAQPADFYICNFEGVGIGAHTRKRFDLDGFSKALSDRADIRLAIVDEASAYKDATTKRHRLARLIFGQKDYLWLLTGTPTPNAPTDAYGLAKLVNGAFGKSETTFKMETMIKVSNFVWKPQKDGYEKARKLLTPSIRFDITDVWDGPEMTTQQREVPLTAEQIQHMAALKRDLQVVVKSGHPITAANEGAARQKFIQISLGAIYDSEHKAHLIDASPRLNELKVVLAEAPGKCLIFAPLTSVVYMLYKELGPQKDKSGKLVHLGWTREVVNGDTSQKDRGRIFQDFQQRADPQLLIADPGCMAHGLDLWMAQTAIWYGSTDKTELYLQAVKRAHRPGQRYPVTVVQLVSNKLEIEIYRRLENNESLQGALLDMVRRGEI